MNPRSTLLGLQVNGLGNRAFTMLPRLNPIRIHTNCTLILICCMCPAASRPAAAAWPVGPGAGPLATRAVTHWPEHLQAPSPTPRPRAAAGLPMTAAGPGRLGIRLGRSDSESESGPPGGAATTASASQSRVTGTDPPSHWQRLLTEADRARLTWRRRAAAAAARAATECTVMPAWAPAGVSARAPGARVPPGPPRGYPHRQSDSQAGPGPAAGRGHSASAAGKPSRSNILYKIV